MKSKRLLILPNHQSTADVPLLMSIFTARIGLTNKVMWIMDRVFKFTNFGIISWMHDDFFIRFGLNAFYLSVTKTSLGPDLEKLGEN